MSHRPSNLQKFFINILNSLSTHHKYSFIQSIDVLTEMSLRSNFKAVEMSNRNYNK